MLATGIAALIIALPIASAAATASTPAPLVTARLATLAMVIGALLMTLGRKTSGRIDHALVGHDFYLVRPRLAGRFTDRDVLNPFQRPAMRLAMRLAMCLSMRRSVRVIAAVAAAAPPSPPAPPRAAFAVFHRRRRHRHFCLGVFLFDNAEVF